MTVRILNEIVEGEVTRLVVEVEQRPAEIVIAPYQGEDDHHRGFRYGVHLVGEVYRDRAAAQEAAIEAAEVLVGRPRVVSIPVIGVLKG